MELIKVGGAKDMKKALKVCKKRLGTHKRGLIKRQGLEERLLCDRNNRHEEKV